MAEPTDRQFDESFEAFLGRRPSVGQAYVNGDAGPLTEISTKHDPATFFGPQGGVIEGADTVLDTNQQGAVSFASGGETRFEVLHSAADGALGYLVGVQRATVRLTGRADEVVEMALRLTELYRREDGSWKLIHRHADPGVTTEA